MSDSGRRGSVKNVSYSTIVTKQKTAISVLLNPRGCGSETFHSQLNKLSLISNTKTGNISKFIPSDYLRASVNQRLSLLQGLMDTDGHIDAKSGRCEFCTISSDLAENFGELLASLGIKYTQRVKHPYATYKGKKVRGQDAYVFSFLVYNNLPVFRLSRKLKRMAKKTDSRRVSETTRRRIVKVERVESVPVRCIQVDSPSHLYLAGKQMIPTHNTEIGNNILGYHLDLDPCPILFLQPTLEMAESYSKERLAPMIRDTPRLRDKLGEGRSRDSNSTLLHKNFAGGHLSMAGANSPASLASRPIRLLLCDEVDRYPASAGAEGDPVDLARKRTTTFWNRKVVLFSTPTIKGASRIEKAYNESDQRKYLVACPHCGFLQPLEWERLLYRGKDTDSPDPQSVFYGCIGCDRSIAPSLKKQILAQGQWIKSRTTQGIAGFYLNELYSPWKAWADVAADYEKARKDAQQLRVWWNTSLGLPWEIQAGEKLLPEQLYERAADSTYSCGEVPVDNCILTAGVDVQGDRLECSVWAWGEGEQSWLVAHEQIFGDPLQEEVWGQLQSITTRKYGDKKITATCIDTGFSTQDVYGQIRKRKHLRWYAVKGKSGEGRAIVGRPRFQEVNYRGKTIKNGVQLYLLGVDAAKEALYARSKITTPGPKYINFPNDVDTGWFQGFCSEVQVIKHRAGQPYYQWEKLPKVRNEPLDCAVYAYAAAILAGVTRIDWQAERSAGSASLTAIAKNKSNTSANNYKICSSKSDWMKRF